MILNVNFLYIDPGTGSMLFSILIGAAATLFFLAKAAWLKIKVFFAGKKDGTAVDTSFKKYVIYNEGNQYWNLFKPICDEFESRKTELTYYTSAQNDPCFNQNYTYVKPEFIGEGNKAYAKLNMLSAGFVLMTTPGLNVYQLKRSKNVKHYANILHGASDATMMKLFALDYFDSVLLTGDYQAKDIRTIEAQRNLNAKNLITVGCPYLDVNKKLLEEIPAEKNHPFTVLVSPSWGSHSLLCKYGEQLLDPLVKSGWRIIVRPHPQSKKAEPQILEALQNKYKDNKNVEWDFEGTNIYSMKKSDIMISDFSGIIYDYTFLCDKPVMYVNASLDLMVYDAYDLKDLDNGKNIWQFNILKKMGIELDDTKFSQITDIIKKASDSKELAKIRKEAKDTAWMFQGNGAKNTVDYMIKTIEG